MDGVCAAVVDGDAQGQQLAVVGRIGEVALR